MPTYEYECAGCGRVFEIRQRISEAPLSTCDVCGGSVRRLLSPAPFILKGDGWYVTDYPSEARKKALESEKGATAKGATEKGATEKGATAKTSDGADKSGSAGTGSGTTAAPSPTTASTSSD